MENLKALVHGRKLNNYQRSLAIQEFEKLQQSNKDANEFIIDIADLLKMDTDSVGYDDIQFSIDDFKDAISALANELYTRDKLSKPNKMEEDKIYKKT